MSLMDRLEGRKAKINRELEKALAIGDNETLRTAMKHYPLAGGKRLRPLLAYLVAEAISGNGETTVPYGVGLELIHNFTLVHDDIMDKSDMRRGILSVHKKFNTPTAIIAGDALFALAFENICNLQIDDALLRIIVNVFQICHSSTARPFAESSTNLLRRIFSRLSTDFRPPDSPAFLAIATISTTGYRKQIPGITVLM